MCSPGKEPKVRFCKVRAELGGPVGSTVDRFIFLVCALGTDGHRLRYCQPRVGAP